MDETPRTLDAGQAGIVALPADASGVVVGAAGTGKTTALVERVRVLMHEGGLTPDEVLVLLPTRQGASDLRDRIGLTVGGATGGALARSVASFSFALVRTAAVRRGEGAPRLLTGADEDRLLDDLLQGDAADELDGIVRWPPQAPSEVRATRGFRAELRVFFARCTELGLGPAALARAAESSDRPMWAALASFFDDYRRVRAAMRGDHRDAAGLAREAVTVLDTADADLLGPLSSLRVVLVDDAQELTRGGVDLLRACRRRGIAVLAFGDPDVGSGAFRGASADGFARLSGELGVAGVLDGVHRSGPALADLVRRVTAHIGAAGVVAHRRAPAGVEPGDAVQAVWTTGVEEEADVIARMLRERHLRDGIPWRELAVIAHDSRQVEALTERLAAREVPTRAGTAGGVLGARRGVRDLLGVLQLAAAGPDAWTSDAITDGLLGVVGGMDAVGLRRLRTALRHAELAAGGDRPSGELLVSGMRHPVEFDALDTVVGRRAARFAVTVAAAADGLAAGLSAHELLWGVWEHSGLQRRWTQASAGAGPLADQAARELDAVVLLFQEAKRFGERAEDGDANAMSFVRGIADAEVTVDRLSVLVADEVPVLTPAGALGREFDTVAVAGVQEGVWPNTRLRGSLLETWRLDAVAGDGADIDDARGRRRQALHDELRLFVRAVSRARSRVVVTAVDDEETGPSVLFEMLPPARPAPPEAVHPLSLRGLVARHRRVLTAEPAASAADRAHAAGQLAVLAASGVPGADPDSWYGVAAPSTDSPLHDLQKEDLRVSPSRLETLERCGLDWVIGDLGGDTSRGGAGMGTLIHAAMENAPSGDAETLWAEVERRWGELVFDADWISRREQAAARELVRRLAGYLRSFVAAGGRVLGAESSFSVDIPLDSEPGPHGARLVGTMDRVEQRGDGSVVVVDLKTGKTVETGSAAVAANAQLGAYQLALRHGAVPEAVGHPSGGAMLLALRPNAASIATPVQEPFDDETEDAFVRRLQDAVAVMTGRTFLAPYEEHCRADHTHGLCRIHTVPAVSAS